MNAQSSNLARQKTDLAQHAEEGVVTATPPVDVFENNDEILVVADFPGVPHDALTVRLDGTELVVEGHQPKGEDWTQPLLFTRTFGVPDTVDPATISAELAHGVLKVHLRKSEQAKPRRIQVKAT